MSTGALAQGTSPAITSATAAGPATRTDQIEPTRVDPLFNALGGRAGLVAIADDLVARLASDPRIGGFFTHTDLPELKTQLADQFCAVAGGPCVYGGADMKKAHGDMHIQRADFNRLVELLQLAMDAHDVSFADQNRLLARLAPMHRDVIERDATAH